MLKVIDCERCGSRAEFDVRRGPTPRRCLDCRVAHKRDWHVAWRTENADKEYATIQRSRFGRPAEEIIALRVGGTCRICKAFDPTGRSFHVDHDHSCCPKGRSCGECIRGLLCNRCNTLVGRMEADADITAAALDYIRENPRIDWSDHQAEVLKDLPSVPD